jgi:polysaccharide biosynthesis transport protein
MLDFAQKRGQDDSGPEGVRISVSQPTHVIGLRDIAGLVMRRSTLIISFVILAMIALSVLVASTTSLYTATAVIVLDRNDGRVLESVTHLDGKERARGTGDRDRAAIETEMDIITSRLFAGKVVDTMNLVNDPWFNPYLGKPNDVGITRAEQRDASITSLLSAMNVTRAGESLAVSIHVQNPDPEMVAALANTVAYTYVEWSRELKLKAMMEAAKFLRERARQVAQASNLGRHHPDVVKTDAEVETVNTMIETEIGRLVGEMSLRKKAFLEDGRVEDQPSAGRQRVLAEVRLHELQRSLMADSKVRDLIVGGMGGEGHAEIASPSARVVSIAAVPSAPSFPQTRRLLAGGLFGATVFAVLFALLVESMDTRVRASHRLEQLVHLPTLAEVPLLRSEAGAGRRVLLVVLLEILRPYAVRFVTFIDRHKAGISAASRVVMRRPIVPIRRESRRRKAAMYRKAYSKAAEEADDRNFEGSRYLSAARNAGQPHSLVEELVRKPFSDYSQALRSLYFVCRSRLFADKPAILFTGPLPDSGTSYVALGFAIAAAQDGMRTVFVSLDSLPTKLTAALPRKRRTLDDVVERFCTVEEAIAPVSTVHGLYHLTSRSLDSEAKAPIRSSSIQTIIEDLRASFEMIVIDCAPVLTHETANWLSPMVNAALIVARSGETTEKQIIETTVRLRNNRAPLIGTVLTGTDARKSPLKVGFPQRARNYFSAEA